MEEILQNKYLIQYVLIILGIVLVFAAALVPLFMSDKEGGSEGEI